MSGFSSGVPTGDYAPECFVELSNGDIVRVETDESGSIKATKATPAKAALSESAAATIGVSEFNASASGVTLAESTRTDGKTALEATYTGVESRLPAVRPLDTGDSSEGANGGESGDERVAALVESAATPLDKKREFAREKWGVEI